MSYGGDRGYGRGPGLQIGAGVILAAVIAVFAVGRYMMQVQVNPVTGERQHIAMSVDQEKALGLKAAPQMAEQMGGEVPEDDPRARLVSQVGRRLVAEGDAGRSPYADNFHFHLLRDPKTINA